MIERRQQHVVAASLGSFPVTAIVGARQVGKTTVAKAIAASMPGAATYLDLELPSHLAKLSEPELFLREHADQLVVLDEVQRKPDLFPLLRALADINPRNGQFLVLGSASPDLLRQSAESLAGRIIYHELAPLSLDEIGGGQGAFAALWSRGGFPKSYLAPSEADSCTWRETFIQTHLERDIPNLGIRVPPSRLRVFWEMIAHCHAQLWNGSKIAGSMGMSVPSANRYLDILQDTFMVRRLQPYHANLKKRLVKSPKVYLRDSGLLHVLLRIPDHRTLTGHPAAGDSWEGWVIEQVAAAVPRTWAMSFYRSSGGAEIDLLLLPPAPRPPIAVEIKFTLSPQPTRGLRSALADLDNPPAFIVYPGEDFYPLDRAIHALPIGQLRRLAE